MRSAHLGAPLGGAKPELADQAAERTNRKPVDTETPPRGRVCEVDARLRLQQRTVPRRGRTQIDRHLRVAGLREAEEVLLWPKLAAARPRPADQDERVRVVDAETLCLERLPDRAPRRRVEAADAEEQGHEGHVREQGRPRRVERRGRRGGDEDRVVLAVVVDRQGVGDRHPAILANGENRAMRVALVALALLAAAPAQAGVRVVPPFDPAEYADRAAIGLLVPGAGPTVTRESALAALLRGELEHDLLGGTAPGDNRIELGRGDRPEILVALPPPGRTDNDVRYSIALLGEPGLLTSDSTRIEGLLSVTDVATGRLRVIAHDDPAAALQTLDD